MSKYIAITYFEDLQDERTVYTAGTVFPRDGVEVSAERLQKLASANNKLGKPVIMHVKELAPKKENEEVDNNSTDESVATLATPDIRELIDSELTDESPIAEIRAHLDEIGFEYPKRANKKELLALIAGD